ncbi:MAG: V-type ATP synthase subunit D [Candidatus Diapherotrites archaeon]|nr:V-type ATP synthase subunit D [Candidatus Diapherotrites archaeon]
MAAEIKTTRLELIETRNMIRLAEKGNQLLKQKKDILVLEFFKILKDAKDLRKDLNENMAYAYSSLGLAESFHGSLEVQTLSLAVAPLAGVEVSSKNIMGVRIPAIKGTDVFKPLGERGYPLESSSAKLDETVEHFQKSLDQIIKLAETENALKRLIKEIEKTKRRVNALDYVVVPTLKDKSKYISMRLEEMEREQFVSLKSIKEKLEKA